MPIFDPYALEYAYPFPTHLSTNRASILYFIARIGQFPTGDGLFEPPALAYFSGL
jgi:hypothetical protein